MIVACLTGAPGAREAAERAVGEMTWGDPEGFMTGGIIGLRARQRRYGAAGAGQGG